MKKTIMVIGGGLLQVPVIQAAKKMGLQVIVTDYNSDAIGMRYADIPLLMSTRDIEGSVRVARKQHELTPISGVLTVGTDASMTVAAVAGALELPGIKFEDAEAATNKIRMRTRFREHGVPSPDFFAVWSLADAKKACTRLGFPVVIKPSDNMGARGVMLLENKNQISDAFQAAKAASPSGELIVEQFMEGPELSIDAVVYNGEVTFTGIADRIIEDLPYFIEKGHTMPSQLPAEIIEEACRVTTLGIKALGINHGLAKGDRKVTPDGVKIGDWPARLSGGFMSAYTFPLSSGVDLMKAAVEIALGQEPGNLEPVFHKVSIERAIITKPGYVTRINGLDEAKQIEGIAEIFLNVKPGDKVVKPKSNVEKAGHIIAVADTLAEAEAVGARCREWLKIEVAEDSEITLETIYAAAREKFNNVCYVCKVCDGEKCASGVPGMGAIGSGESFRRNIASLNEYKVNTRVIHDVTEPELSSELFGVRLDLPVLASPITGAVTNMSGAITEAEYAEAVIQGCAASGALGCVGDGATPDKYRIGLAAIKNGNGRGIAIFKPRSERNDILERIKAAEEAGALAVGMDIDAVVFKTMKMRNQSVGPKGLEELQKIIASTKLPFVLKGIMNPVDARLAVEAGAQAIMVSNHGGRVLDQMCGVMDVLPAIVKEVQGKVKVLADGGFRNGVDVLKALALGADGVCIGRPVAIAAVGMNDRGVSFYLDMVKDDLRKAMILTGCQSVGAISRDCVSRLEAYREEV
jgi:isopentenyl diphosphate isomerase/L-lactate dehydrogenase-like FMN-dependent dehydrogenase/biotin carboxylase